MTGAAARVGETFVERVTFDAASIRAFASLCGDLNPLHHDEAAAARSPFGSMIVSGPHVTALMMGITATHYMREFAPLGLDFTFRFVRAIRAGTTLNLKWTLASVARKETLRGDLATLEGKAVDDAGGVYVTASGTLLLRPLAQPPTGGR